MNSERLRFENLMRELRFPAYAIKRLDEMYKRPGEDFKLQCIGVGIAMPLDMTEILLTLNFKALNGDIGFDATDYRAVIHHKASGQVRGHTFPIGENVTRNVDEAFALLDGRAVQRKEPNSLGIKTIWEQMDFTSRDNDDNYKIIQYSDFDFEKALARLPFIDHLSRDKIKELRSQLTKGDLAPVELKNQQVYLVANPSERTIIACTAEGIAIAHDHLKQKPTIADFVRRQFTRKRGKGI